MYTVTRELVRRYRTDDTGAKLGGHCGYQATRILENRVHIDRDRNTSFFWTVLLSD
jgi:hypothetical protein